MSRHLVATPITAQAAAIPGPIGFELPLWPFVLTALAATLLATVLSLRLNQPPADHPDAAPRRLAIRLLLLGALLLGAGAWVLAPR